ncbi:MAG: calcium/sodium antiporter [Methanosarcina sp.]
MLFINILIFVIGLALLVKGADLFVEAASLIAKRFGVSEFIIGLTLVSVGTSIPELASSVTAVFQNASGIIIGNILGSNIANIGLIVGISALLSEIGTDRLMLKRDGYIMLFASVLLFLFIFDLRISQAEAFIFLLLYIAYLFFLLDKVKNNEGDIYFKDFLIYFLKFEYLSDLKSRMQAGPTVNKKIEKIEMPAPIIEKNSDIETIQASNIEKNMFENEEIDIDLEAKKFSESSLTMLFLKLIASGIAIIAGADFFVNQAIFFARFFEVSETLIGLTLVAIGTSVPELMVTASAARSGYSEIALGNIIGSNTSNILLILGCSGLIGPLQITELSRSYIAPCMLFISTFFLLFIRTGWRIKRYEGLILLLLYFGFIIFIVRLG